MFDVAEKYRSTASFYMSSIILKKTVVLLVFIGQYPDALHLN